jgi:hypothetical protein
MLGMRHAIEEYGFIWPGEIPFEAFRFALVRHRNSE